MKCSNQVCRGIKQIASKFSHYNLNKLSMSIENIIITPREDIFSLSATKNKIFYVRLQIHFDAGKLFHTILQILSNCYMKQVLQCSKWLTFLTDLSGSIAMSGMLALTINVNRFRMRLEDLKTIIMLTFTSSIFASFLPKKVYKISHTHTFKILFLKST